MEDYILNYILLFALLEIYEVQWQKAHTMIGMLSRMYQYYQKSIFLFLVMHPTFYFAIMFTMLSEYNIYAIILLLIKTVDIITKMLLIKQIFIQKDISDELKVVLFMPLNDFMPYIGLLVYPPLIYMALL